MGVVELDRGLVGQRVQRVVLLQVAAQQVLQRGGHEEVLLPQAQFLPGRRGVARVQDLGDGFLPHAVGQRPHVVAGIERVEPQRIDGAGLPEPQRVDVAAAPAHHGRVVGDSLHGLGRVPHVARHPVGRVHALDAAPEADVVGDRRALELPRVAARQPVFRVFLLPAVLDDLPEQAVLVADAVAVSRHRQGCHAFHEAGREATQAAVAERRIRLDLAQPVQIDVQAREGLAHRLDNPEVGQPVEQQAADQELERHVVDALGARPIGTLVGVAPALHDAVADRERGGHVPVALGGARHGLADRVVQLGHNRVAQGFDVARCRGGDRGRSFQDHGHVVSSSRRGGDCGSRQPSATVVTLA